MDSNAFFREATLRICGSLEIETALWHTLKYLREYIPAEKAFLHYYDPDSATSTVSASADAQSGQKHNFRAKWPDEWHRIATQDQLPKNIVLHDADTHPIARLMLGPFLEKGRFSLIVVRLSVGQDWIGGVTLWSPGRNRFTEEHLELFSLLHDPFAIALSNFRRYEQLMEHKDQLIDDKQYLEAELRRDLEIDIVGANQGLKTVMQRVGQVAHLDSPVLLLGETGAGKEVVANAIHNGSPRRNGPFVKVNCGAIPDTLIDSELFGFEKGAFTGALARKRGRFERAHGGTLFLDEIGELPINAQVRLLRVLQEKEIERIGGHESISVDIRIIAATHRDLPSMIEWGHFRQDLYFRLQVFPIEIPPLRERLGDLPALAKYFIAKKAREFSLPEIPVLEKEAISFLGSYHWPGNIRELENAIERAIIISGGGPLSFEEFSPGARHGKAAQAAGGRADPSDRLDDVIRQHIKEVLQGTGGKVGGANGAAEVLDINESTLRHKMRKLSIPFGRQA